jgi:hypothetical protein
VVFILRTKISISSGTKIVPDLEGHLFGYTTAVFESCKDRFITEQARNSLIALLTTEEDQVQGKIIEFCVSTSYQMNDTVFREYFLSLVEAITSGTDLYYDLPKIVTLSFFHMSHQDLIIRKSATELLHWLSTRFFRTHKDTLRLHSTSQSPDQYLQQLVS